MTKHFKQPLNEERKHRNLPKQQLVVKIRDKGVDRVVIVAKQQQVSIEPKVVIVRMCSVRVRVSNFEGLCRIGLGRRVLARVEVLERKRDKNDFMIYNFNDFLNIFFCTFKI